MREGLFASTLLLLVFISGYSHAAGIDVLYYLDMAPFAFLDEEGSLQGSAVDIVREIMAAADNPLGPESFRHVPWARALDDVERFAGRGLFCLVKNSKRKKLFKWVGPISETYFELWAKKSRAIRINGPEDIGKYKIGIIRHSAPEHILTNDFKVGRAMLKSFNTIDSQLKMLDDLRLDLIVLANPNARWLIQLRGIDLNPFERVFVLRKFDLYLALNKDTDDNLVFKLQAALEALKERQEERPSRYEQIINKYK